MARPPEIEVVRRACELWEQSGKPEGQDHEFYLQALHELQEAFDRTHRTGLIQMGHKADVGRVLTAKTRRKGADIAARLLCANKRHRSRMAAQSAGTVN
jgi:hypothetical protein